MGSPSSTVREPEAYRRTRSSMTLKMPIALRSSWVLPRLAMGRRRSIGSHSAMRYAAVTIADLVAAITCAGAISFAVVQYRAAQSAGADTMSLRNAHEGLQAPIGKLRAISRR